MESSSPTTGFNLLQNYFLGGSRHRLRWLFVILAVSCFVIVVVSQIPPTVAKIFLAVSAIAGLLSYVAWRLERWAHLTLSAEADRLEAEWNAFAARTPPPGNWVAADAYWRYAEPDFWAAAQRQLLDGDWRIEGYLANEFSADAMAVVELFHDVTDEERAAAPRRASFAADTAAIGRPHELEPLGGAGWPRCCGEHARLIGLLDRHGRPAGDVEPTFLVVPLPTEDEVAAGAERTVSLADLPHGPFPWPAHPALGFECSRCGGRYTPRRAS